VSDTPQVRIQVMGTDGEWTQPDFNEDALLSALVAAKLDLVTMSGDYRRAGLVKIRQAAIELANQAGRNLSVAEG
jgi:hypothetical protein